MGNDGIQMGMMLKGKLFMVLLFFLMLLFVRSFQFPVMFRYEDEYVIAVLLAVEFGMFDEFIDLHQIVGVKADRLQ